jgi:hypothetical protein
MSRKTYTWIVILTLIILGFVAWWLFSHENKAVPASQPAQTNQNLFPYGQNATSSSNGSEASGGQGTVIVGNSPTTPPALVHITMTPVSGAIFLPEGKNSSTTTLRYIDRATGHIYDYSFDTGTSTEVTNTTIPKVYEGSFSSTGARAYLQTLDESSQIETVSAAVPTAATTGPTALTDVRFLPKNIISIATNASSLFYLVKTANGSAGYVSALDGTKASQVVSPSLSELIAAWQSPSITLTTKASASAGGYFFNVNTKTGGLTPLIDDIPGLTAFANPAGTFVFGSESGGGTIQSFIYDEKKGATRTIPLSTLADKCAWSRINPNAIYCAVPTSTSGNLPDDWYQGNISLSSDNIWKISADTGVTNIIDFLSERNPNIDAEKLSLDGNEKWVAFTDKQDLTLWALRIGQ